MDSVDLHCEHPLHPAVGWLAAARRLGSWLVLITLASTFAVMAGRPELDWLLAHPLALLAMALVITGHSLLPIPSYQCWRWQVTEHSFLRHSGWLVRRQVAVPLARIQQVDTRSGALDRWLGLATVQVHSAGSRAARVDVPGIPAETAEILRQHLADVADSHAT